MPTHILYIQGAVVTIISLAYFLFKDVSVAFFLISAMTITLYLIAYMLMYVAAVVLRYTKPNLQRPFVVPGGLRGMWITSGIGFFGVLFSFVVAFFPPSQLPVGSPALYVWVVVAGTVILCGIPLVVHHVRKPGWASRTQPATLKSFGRRRRTKVLEERTRGGQASVYGDLGFSLMQDGARRSPRHFHQPASLRFRRAVCRFCALQ